MKTIKKISLAGFFLLGMLAFNVDANANEFTDGTDGKECYDQFKYKGNEQLKRWCLDCRKKSGKEFTLKSSCK